MHFEDEKLHLTVCSVAICRKNDIMKKTRKQGGGAVKFRLEQIDRGEEEILIRYRDMDSRIHRIAEAVGQAIQEMNAEQKRDKITDAKVDGTHAAGMNGPDGAWRITASWEGQTMYVDPREVYYLETVDGVTYAYLQDKVVRISERLKMLEILYKEQGFFRCSKAMILNIHRISYLKSEPGSRIRATLENGEQVIISRKYGKTLRKILKGGSRDEV